MWRRRHWFQRHVVHERLLARAYPFTQRCRRIRMKPLEEPCGGYRAIRCGKGKQPIGGSTKAPAWTCLQPCAA